MTLQYLDIFPSIHGHWDLIHYLVATTRVNNCVTILFCMKILINQSHDTVVWIYSYNCGLTQLMRSICFCQWTDVVGDPFITIRSGFQQKPRRIAFLKLPNYINISDVSPYQSNSIIALSAPLSRRCDLRDPLIQFLDLLV